MMSEFIQNEDIPDIISALSARFAKHERYAELERAIDRLIAVRLADLRAGRFQEADSLVLTAATGSGKTTAMRRLIRKARSRLSKSDLPDSQIISLTVPSPATLKAVGISILAALDFRLKADRQSWYIWDLVRFHLAENKVLFLHLDEAQDLKRKGRQNELPDIVNTLKSISQDTDWPVGFLLSGTEDLKEIVNFDRQLVKRMKAVSFEPLSPQSDAVDMVSLIETYAVRAGLVLDAQEKEKDLGKRILHAASYQFGLVIKLAVFAIEVALYAGDRRLTIAHFAEAFREWKGCTAAFNPFLVSDYTQIDPQQMFTSQEVF